MNIRKKLMFLGIILTLVSFTPKKPITGPSTIESEIRPIAISKNGEILCKTRFTKNEMGAYGPMPIEYGFCVITKDTIIELITKVIEPTPDDSYDKEKKYWDEIFQSKTNTKQLESIKKVVLKDKYDFSIENIDTFKVDEILSISEFEATRKISLKNNAQKALHGASSMVYSKGKKVHLLYDFGEILIFNNYYGFEDLGELGKEVGANFNYYFFDTQNEDKLEFDFGSVTGVLVIQ